MGVEENYFIDVDISDNLNESVVFVYKGCGSKLKLMKAFTGKEAVKIHNLMTGKEKLK